MGSTYCFKFFPGNEIIILETLLINLFGSCCMTDFSLKNTLVFGEDVADQSVLAYSRWSNKNYWLTLQWCGIEWAEIFFGENEYIVLLNKIEYKLLD